MSKTYKFIPGDIVQTRSSSGHKIEENFMVVRVEKYRERLILSMGRKGERFGETAAWCTLVERPNPIRAAISLLSESIRHSLP